MRSVHFVLPNDIDDPATPSGGNVYDRKVCRALAAAGWSVFEHAVLGNWPHAGPLQRARVARVLASLPDDSVVLLDGLVASVVAGVLLSHAKRLRLIPLVHMPVGDATKELRAEEQRALSAATAIVTTSFWCRERLLELYPLRADRVYAAPPGVEPAPLASGSDGGPRLLCVAAVTQQKGHDILLDALARITELSWTCVCVGPLHREPLFARQVRGHARERGLAHRLRFVGPATGPSLATSYAEADLLVLASRGETYGMVVTEALARGTPVVATAADGLPEALGRAPDGSVPGILVPPENPSALAAALRSWLTDVELRRHLRRSARQRRTMLPRWAETATVIAGVLSGAEP